MEVDRSEVDLFTAMSQFGTRQESAIAEEPARRTEYSCRHRTKISAINHTLQRLPNIFLINALVVVVNVYYFNKRHTKNRKVLSNS